MGFKTLSPTVVSSITPASKTPAVKAFQVARTELAAVLKTVLPASASILYIVREGSVASDAETTATVTLVAANNSGTFSTFADDVKTNGATTGFVQMTALPNLEVLPAAGDITITAVYAETGAASTVGGPWNYLVHYVL